VKKMVDLNDFSASVGLPLRRACEYFSRLGGTSRPDARRERDF